jgi:hypothetical protein
MTVLFFCISFSLNQTDQPSRCKALPQSMLRACRYRYDSVPAGYYQIVVMTLGDPLPVAGSFTASWENIP